MKGNKYYTWLVAADFYSNRHSGSVGFNQVPLKLRRSYLLVVV